MIVFLSRNQLKYKLKHIAEILVYVIYSIMSLQMRVVRSRSVDTTQAILVPNAKYSK